LLDRKAALARSAAARSNCRCFSRIHVALVLWQLQGGWRLVKVAMQLVSNSCQQHTLQGIAYLSKHRQAAVQVLWASLHPASISVPAAASFECAFLCTDAGSSRACSHNPAASSQHACRLQHQQHGNPAAPAVTTAPATATVQSWPTCSQLELQPHVRLAPATAAAAASKAVQPHHTTTAAVMLQQLVPLMM
jgi:hypothetical protein